MGQVANEFVKVRHPVIVRIGASRVHRVGRTGETGDAAEQRLARADAIGPAILGQGA